MRKRVLVVLALALVVAIALPAFAQRPPTRVSQVTFKVPTMVPGKTLDPGTYKFRLSMPSRPTTPSSRSSTPRLTRSSTAS